MSDKLIREVLVLGLLFTIQSCSNPSLTHEPEIVIEDLSGEDIISFEIYFEELEYSISGDVPIHMIIKNQGAKPVIFNQNTIITGPNWGEEVSLIFYIQDPSGVILPFGPITMQVIRTQPSDFIILEQNEEINLIAYLNSYFNFSEVGDYTVKAVYNNTLDHPDGRPAWKGTVESNIASFKLIP